MPNSESPSQAIIGWFRKLVRPILEKTEAATVLQEFDKLASHIEELDKNKDRLFPICLLGQAGVGKSTLINTLISDVDIVVPSGGGTGPLTANAVRVSYGEKPCFVVRYHSRKRIGQARFILEAEVHRQRREDLAEVELDRDSDVPEAMELDADEQKKSRTEEAIGRARLLIAGAQSASRDLTYLADALRWVLGQSLKFHSQILAEDMERLRQVQEVLKYGETGETRRFDSAGNPEFGRCLRDHASGFLAPLILDMSIQWPSALLQNSVELVDLPGVGILSDVYASVTSDYLRNRAKAVMLVTDSRGVRREDAELLRDTGFLNRLLHAGSDPAADPVALIVVVVKIDDVAVENWRNDKAINNGTALKTKVQHFADQVEHSRNDVCQNLRTFLRDVWEDDTEGKRLVIQNILESLQVFPVSAPQYRLICSKDLDDDRPFLPDIEATNIVTLRAAITRVAQRCLEEQTRRYKETHQRFFGQLRAKLKVLSAQKSNEQHAEDEIQQFKDELGSFMAPLQREFDARRGGFRNFLRKTIPTLIKSQVETASTKARKDIQNYLRTLRDAHWKTLQAAVRKEGTFYGSRKINLPNDFALRFESPVAEVWSREILVDLRRETRDFAEYESDIVTKILEWARTQRIRVSTSLLEALLDAVKQRRQQVNGVGKEAVDELRDNVRAELIKKIEGPIRRRCQKFVADRQDFGGGVRNRILELFEELADEVVQAAADPAITLLVDRFKEVEKEILVAFGEHNEPLTEAAETLTKRQEKKIRKEDVQLLAAIESALDSVPPGFAALETGISRCQPL